MAGLLAVVEDALRHRVHLLDEGGGDFGEVAEGDVGAVHDEDVAQGDVLQGLGLVDAVRDVGHDAFGVPGLRTILFEAKAEDAVQVFG